jgi:hypothetical protein
MPSAVIYEIGSKNVRRVIVADTDAEVQSAVTGGIAADEAVLLVPGTPKTREEIFEMLAEIETCEARAAGK